MQVMCRLINGIRSVYNGLQFNIIYRSGVYDRRLFIIHSRSNNGNTLRQKTMGTEREEKMDGIDLMIAIIGAVIILTWYI